MDQTLINPRYSTSIKDLDILDNFAPEDILNRNRDSFSQYYPDTDTSLDPTKTTNYNDIEVYFPKPKPPPETERIGISNDRLDALSKKANEHKPQELEDLTIRDFFKKTANAYMNIINAIFTGTISIDLLLVDENLIAIALLMILVSIFFIFFQKM